MLIYKIVNGGQSMSKSHGMFILLKSCFHRPKHRETIPVLAIPFLRLAPGKNELFGSISKLASLLPNLEIHMRKRKRRKLKDG